MYFRRIRYAMAHLSHREHISLLAKPNWRKIGKTDPNILSSPFTTARSALKARASQRIKIMARPKFFSKKYDAARPSPGYRQIHPKVLVAKVTKRTQDLAIPKKRSLISSLRHAAVNKKIKKNLQNQLSKLETSRYQKYRILCNANFDREEFEQGRKQTGKLGKAAKKRVQDWEALAEIFARLASPKKLARPKRARKREWKPVNMERVKQLAQPVIREQPEHRDPFLVSNKALTYRITKRLNNLVYRKKPPASLPPRVPGAVSPAAKKAIASPRTIVLAKPAVRPAGLETDLKENAFTVSPAALKAKCSKRLKILAKPKIYEKSISQS